jgi:hypothetical protein
MCNSDFDECIPATGVNFQSCSVELVKLESNAEEQHRGAKLQVQEKGLISMVKSVGHG